MKKWIMITIMVALLTGCGTVETFETLGDISHVSGTIPELRPVTLDIPEEAALETNANEEGLRMYSCDGYILVLQMLEAGDLAATVRTICGFTPERVTMMESSCTDHDRYDWVWTAAAEEGELVCRAAVLDDGDYHYALCVMASAKDAEAFTTQWNALFASFCLETGN